MHNVQSAWRHRMRPGFPVTRIVCRLLCRPVNIANHSAVTAPTPGPLTFRLQASYCGILIDARGHTARDEHGSIHEVQRLARSMMAVRALQAGPYVTAHTCDRATFFIFRTTDAYIAITPRARRNLTRARYSLAWLSVPAYPPSLFPFLASFSALGLTCSTQDLENEGLPITAIGDLPCRSSKSTGFVQPRTCLSSLGWPSFCLSCIGIIVLLLLSSYRRAG